MCVRVCTWVCACVCESPQQHLFFMMQHFSVSIHTTGLRSGIPELFLFFFATPPFCLTPGVLQAALQFASQQHTLLHKHKRPGITVSPGEDVASSRTWWSRAGDEAEGANGANHWDPCQKLQRFNSLNISPHYEHVYNMSPTCLH